MAIFRRMEVQPNLVTVYFSPALEQLAKAHGAEPCEKPENTENLNLFSGDARAWEIFYSGVTADPNS